MREIQRSYFTNKSEIEKRLGEFKRVLDTKTEREVFAELVFCLLTPQSKAKTCWRAVSNIVKKKLIYNGSTAALSNELKSVRFRNNKARYICEARKIFSCKGNINVKSRLNRSQGAFKIRDWLVQNVKGLGYKEASHFLRNVGLGKDMAILDRHVLKNLKLCEVIDEIPGSLSKKKYFEIEKKMIRYAKRIGIPVGHFDLVLWHRETGEIFK